MEAVFHWFKYLYSFEFVYTLAMLSVKFSMYAPPSSPTSPRVKNLPTLATTCLTERAPQHPLPIPNLPNCSIPPHPSLVPPLCSLPRRRLHPHFNLPMRTHSRFLGHAGRETLA